jgi:hypothetical protein
MLYGQQVEVYELTNERQPGLRGGADSAERNSIIHLPLSWQTTEVQIKDAYILIRPSAFLHH